MSSSTENLVDPESQSDQNNETPQTEAILIVAASPSICYCGITTRKFMSLAYMGVIFLLAIVFLVVVKVNTDTKALHVNTNSPYRYLTIMLIVAIIWMAVLIFSKTLPERWRDKRLAKWLAKQLAKHEEPAKELIPPRLLVGVMFFGLGSSFMTLVEFLEYLPADDCPAGNADKLWYYAVRTVFIYTQLYFFYKLSRSSKKTLFFSHLLTMHLIAVNLGTWIVTFVDDSADELQDHADGVNATELVAFMARKWGVSMNHTTLTNSTCEKRAENLKLTVESMSPYFYTFTMEYCLISAGLLLNVWLSLKSDVREEATPARERVPNGDRGETSSDIRAMHSETWETVDTPESIQEGKTLWRFGFIFGLVYVPAFAAIIVNIMFTDTKDEDSLVYVGFQFFFFLSVLVASVYGSSQLEKQDTKDVVHSYVDYYLLASALVGIFFLDMFIIIASVCVVVERTSIALLLVFTNFLELVCSVAFTHFVHKALERFLNLDTDKPSAAQGSNQQRSEKLRSASQIREVVSFLFMLNLCFWGMYTFEVKKSNMVISLVEDFYGERIWFYISHMVYPLAIFFHFHGAVCMVEILENYSRVPLKRTSSSTISVSSANHVARAKSRDGGQQTTDSTRAV